MWYRLKSRVSEQNVNELKRRLDSMELARKCDGMFYKSFFIDGKSGDSNLDLLRQIHFDVWPELVGAVAFKLPAVDHASLLIKNPGSPATGLHQDRAYWQTREAKPSIFSVWIALDDMRETLGGLMLSQCNEIDICSLDKFNTGLLFEHEEVDTENVSGEFPLLISSAFASDIEESMRFIDLKKGEAIAFDSFEPHMTRANTEKNRRFAMKIAYCEGWERNGYLTQTESLENNLC